MAFTKIRICKCGTTGTAGVEFYANQGNRCKECTKKHDRERRARDREAGNEAYQHRIKYLAEYTARRKYGMTHDEAVERFGDVCMICGDAAGADDRTRLSIDHCHATGVVRGLLCNLCNRMLGFARDNPELLEKAAAYLRACR